MTIKQFKTKFKKHCENIERELEKITALSEDLDDTALSEIIEAIVSNVYITLIDNTSEQPSEVTLATYQEYLDELDELESNYDCEIEEE